MDSKIRHRKKGTFLILLGDFGSLMKLLLPSYNRVHRLFVPAREVCYLQDSHVTISQENVDRGSDPEITMLALR